MEILVVLFFLCLSKRHHQGFSHFEQKGWKQVFFLNEQEGADLYINGFRAGANSDVFYFPQETTEVVVQYFEYQELVYEKTVFLSEDRTLIQARCKEAHLRMVK